MYNEGKCIFHNINDIVIPFLKDNFSSFEVILVNDGSKDNTLEESNKIDGVNVVSYSPNGGKGKAVREGFKAATGDLVLFMDADLSTDLSCINKIISEMEDNDICIGNRHMKNAKILVKSPFFRRVMSKVSNLLVKMVCRVKSSDTQCGFKLYTRKAVNLILERSIIDGFAFDVEHIYIAKVNGLAYKNVPVIWSNDRDSKVSPIKSSLVFFKDCFKIRRHKKHYKGN